jgi:Undecaprenyl-phosphate galactose phosphotransferase WbaP
VHRDQLCPVSGRSQPFIFAKGKVQVMSATQPLVYAPAQIRAKRFSSSFWATSLSILTADVLSFSAVYWIAVIGRYLFYPDYALRTYLTLYPVTLVVIAAFYAHSLYPGVLLHPAEEIKRVCKSVTVVLLVLALVVFLTRNAEMYSRSIFLTVWAAGIPCVILMRHLVRGLLSKRPWWGISAVIVGQGPYTEQVLKNLAKQHPGLRVTRILGGNGSGSILPEPGGRFTGEERRGHVADYALVAAPDATNSQLRHIMQHLCRGFRHVLLVPGLSGICSLGTVAHEIGGEVGLEIDQRLCYRSATLIKRFWDIVLSALLLLALAPLFVLVAALIKSISKGPVFFGHTRYGQSGQVFKALKFRTMVPDAEIVLAKYLAEHPDMNEEWEREQKLRRDPRITTVGRFLRRYSIDELPQLINVLQGKMSLVGPRPIVGSEIERYGEGFDLYTRVVPGITGLWQVSGRNNTTYAERVAFDEYYVRNWSIWLDLYILTKTFHAVVTADGAF